MRGGLGGDVLELARGSCAHLGAACVADRRQRRQRPAPRGRCCGSRCTGTGCLRGPRAPRCSVGCGFSASRPTVAITMPGVQKPHCRPCSAGTRPAPDAARPSARGPSAVVTSWPAACTASTVQDLTDLPFEQHGARAARGRVAADVGRPQAEHLAQVVHEQQPRLDLVGSLLAVDGELDVRHACSDPALAAAACCMACQTRREEAGMSMCRTPRCATASTIAFCTAGVAPIVPASPMPLAPSGL